jgi:hypothetical protein
MTGFPAGTKRLPSGFELTVTMPVAFSMMSKELTRIKDHDVRYF